MAQWYDEEMPGQDDGYERFYYPERFENKEDNAPENEDYYDIMYRNLREGKNADGTEDKPKVIPAIGSKWRHYNGIPYTVLHIANIGGSDNYAETVIIQGANGKVWTRVLSDWHRSFTEINGTQVQ